ncbi:hypothetical protein [Undibacterium sp. Tian12W]|uniref:hypothetical protein n=1 Tax=Undibacterium sp. Tian12W TaxID=3413054 RepID=UPI003BF481CD
MKNKKPKNQMLETIEVLLEVIGPEASLGKEAWDDIASLDITKTDGIRTLVRNYVLPYYLACSESFKEGYLNYLEKLLADDNVAWEEIHMDEYPYIEDVPPRLFFSILHEEIKGNGKTE